MSAEMQYQNKTLGDLGMEAFWFVAHTAIAVLVLAGLLYAGMVLKVDPLAVEPKLIGTAAAFFVPLAVGFLVAKWKHNGIARHVWLSGLLLFATACVWVLDLPTGPGLCEHCGAVDKLSRTFFDVTHGSGLMGGDGLMVGVWIPLALFGYAIGAGMGLEKRA